MAEAKHSTRVAILTPPVEWFDYDYDCACGYTWCEEWVVADQAQCMQCGEYVEPSGSRPIRDVDPEK